MPYQMIDRGIITDKTWSYQLRGESWSTPALCDVNGDGVMDVITACRAGWIYAIDGHSGDEIWATSARDEITASPIVAHVGNNEDPRVFIGSHDGAMHCLDARTGAVHWKFQTNNRIRTRPTISDVNGDGRLELIFASYGGNVYCCDALTGEVKWHAVLSPMRWLTDATWGMVSSPLVIESHGSGNSVVILGTRTNRTYALDAATGETLWFATILSGSDASPSIATIDGQPAAIIGSGESLDGGGNKTVYALDVETGRRRWTYRAWGGMDGAPTVADIDGDGQAEIVVTSLADASIYALRVEDGSLMWRYSIPETDACTHHKNNWCIPTGEKHYHTARAICKSFNSPLVVDSDTDSGRLVIFGSNNGSLYILNGKTGDLVERVSLDGPIRGSPVVACLNGDESASLVVTAGSTVVALNIANGVTELQRPRDNNLNSGNVFDPLLPSVTRPVAPGRTLGLRLRASEQIGDTGYYIWYQVKKQLRKLGLDPPGI